MIDIKLIRENRDLVKENIKKKFQDEKLSLVDEVYDLDNEYRDCKLKGDNLRGEKNKLSSEVGFLMRDKKVDEANEIKKKVSEMQSEIEELGKKEAELEAKNGKVKSLKAMKAEKEQLAVDIEELNDLIGGIEDSIPELEAKVEEANAKLALAQTGYDKAKAEYTTVNDKFQAEEAKKKAEEEKKKAEQATAQTGINLGLAPEMAAFAGSIATAVYVLVRKKEEHD